MRILLANPPWRHKDRKGVRAGSRWPHLKAPEEEDYLPFPFFLAYAHNLLKKKGFDSEIIDAIAEDMSEKSFFEKIKEINPEIIFLEVSTPSLDNDKRLIRKMKEFFDIRIAVAGMAVIDKKFMEDNPKVDFGLFGEYEYTLLELFDNLEGQKDISNIKGLIYQKNGKVVKNSARALIQNLDELPWTYTEDLPMKKYHDCPGSIPTPSAQIWASRGCPFNCTFCAWPQIMYKPYTYRTRSVRDIVDEMEFLQKKGFRSIYFDDDTFNVGKKRMLQLCKEIKKRELNMPWAIMARADLMDKEILTVMKEAGLHALKYGVESSSQQLLDNCNKKLDIKKAEKNILLTQKLGIKTHLTFTFGLRGETKKTIQDTIDFAIRMDPESVQFSITTPFPGTKYFEELKSEGKLISDKERDFDGNFKAVIKNEELSPKELEAAVKKAYGAWRLHVSKRNKKTSPLKLFFDCLKEHNLKYTLKHTIDYIFRRKKDENSENVLNRINKESNAFTGPEYVTIDITNRCNLNCIACWTFSPLLGDKKPAKEWFKQELAYEKIEELVNQLSELGTREIRITGGGEPFLHKNIFKIIDLIKNQGMKCDITTNLTLLNKDRITKLVETGIDNITISVWAGDAETYIKTHPNQKKENFENLKENIIFLNKIKKKETETVIANVLSNINYESIDGMVSFGKETDSDEIYFTFMDPIEGATDKISLSDEERKRVLEKLRKLKRKNDNISIDISHRMKKGMKCYVGNFFSRIMANGDVAPCCTAVNNITGNINEQSFKHIWSGRKQEEFRREGLRMSKEFTDSIGCYKTCDNWWQNEKVNSFIKRRL